MTTYRGDPAAEGRHAAAIDDGGLVGGTPADQGIIAAKIDDAVTEAAMERAYAILAIARARAQMAKVRAEMAK